MRSAIVERLRRHLRGGSLDRRAVVATGIAGAAASGGAVVAALALYREPDDLGSGADIGRGFTVLLVLGITLFVTAVIGAVVARHGKRSDTGFSAGWLAFGLTAVPYALWLDRGVTFLPLLAGLMLVLGAPIYLGAEVGGRWFDRREERRSAR